MVRKRWLWVGVIALVVVLVPALLWSGRRPPAPAVEQEGAPPALAAEGNDLQPDDEGQEAPLLVVAEMDAVVTVVDGTTGAVKQALGQAVLAPDASLLYNVEQEAGQTRVQAVEPETGRVAGEIAFRGRYDLPWVGSLPGGLSPGGRWLVLQRLLWLENGAREAGSRFAVVDPSFDAAPRMVELDGQFEFDAVSDDGRRLYLTEYVVSEYARREPLFERNAIRLYDLARGRLEQAVVVTKRSEEEEEMSGYRRAAVASPDGTWLYSLYVDDAHSSPFVHVLNLDEGYAICIDLPGVPAHRALDPMLWGLALSPGGETLYAANASAEMVFEIDTAGLVVRRSVDLESAGAGDTALERLARYLAPVARAKVGVVNPVLLSPDGDTLYALATNGLLALDTADLAVRGEYLTDRKLNSLAVSRDGAALYAVTLEPSRILRVAPETGEIVAMLEKEAFWAGILAVGGTPALNGAESGSSVPATCDVTRPQEPPFLPAGPYAAAPERGSFWHGSQDLWTMVPASGTWPALPQGPRGYTQKTFWWQPGYDAQVEPEPDLVVTGRRLLGGGPAPALEALRATNGFTGDWDSFMLAAVEVPEAGCWEITGRVGGQELSYVVWVAP